MENDALYQPEEGPWVLLVEHDLRLIQTLRVIFERMRHGAIVVAVSDGLSAIALASQMSADLILLDLDIPLFNMDGIQVCTSLRRLTSAPIIMLSGLEATADIARGLEAGADDYVVKPFGSAVLGARAQALIRRSRMTATDVKTRAGRGGGEGLPG
jgi:two-component system response regulator MtrA